MWRQIKWTEWAKMIVIAVVLAIIIRSFIFSSSIVQGDSMEPTLESGERIIFNKLVYFIEKPKRGEVVIIQRTHKNYVKRIIGLPGEVVEVRDHTLYIDNEQYEQGFIAEEIANLTGDIGPIKVPNNSYYVMGDNRPISKDSRNGLGFINEDDIIGRSEFIIYPLKNIAIIK